MHGSQRAPLSTRLVLPLIVVNFLLSTTTTTTTTATTITNAAVTSNMSVPPCLVKCRLQTRYKFLETVPGAFYRIVIDLIHVKVACDKKTLPGLR